MKKSLILLLLGLHGLMAMAQQDTLATLRQPLQLPLSSYGYRYGMYNYGWGLHEGLNVSIELTAFATFGQHAPPKGGFGQRLAATFLTPMIGIASWRGR